MSQLVLITGAAKRIGAAIARELADAGYALALHCHRSRVEADALAQELRARGTKVLVCMADLSDEASVKQLIPSIVQELGAITAVVNNASTFEYDNISSFSSATALKHYAVNTIAPLLLARSLHEHLAEGAQGCVINLLDQKLWNMNPDYLSYTLSKAALQTATAALAQALAPRVRVCGVAPGVTLPSSDAALENEAFSAAQGMTPLGKASQPEDIAKAVRYLLSATAVTGTTLLVDGGQHLIAQSRDVAFLVNKI
jgi:NAD(P)-dependent dehydrogenase (short-subunit alcohol dehydrogenase family)